MPSDPESCRSTSGDHSPAAVRSRSNLARYLSGQPPNEGPLRATFRSLSVEAPELLAALERTLLGEVQGDVLRSDVTCQEVLETLTDDSTAGTDAGLALPIIHAHLHSCAECRRAMVALREASDAEAEWLEFARALEERPEAALVGLARTGWFWLRGQFRVPLRREEFQLCQQLGRFTLRPTPASETPSGMRALHMGERWEELHLSLDLPRGVGEIHLAISPKHPPGDQGRVWVFKVELVRSIALQWVSIRIGPERRRAHGPFPLEQRTQFDLPPPSSAHLHWLFLEWQAASGEAGEFAAQVPLIELEEEGV